MIHGQKNIKFCSPLSKSLETHSLNHLAVVWKLFKLGFILWMGSNIKVFMFLVKFVVHI